MLWNQATTRRATSLVQRILPLYLLSGTPAASLNCDMYFRAALTFLGEEWERLHRFIDALEREAEEHHRRHLADNSGTNREPSRQQAAQGAGFQTDIQPNPWGF